MKNIIITATAESVEQAQALIDAGVDRIYVGEKDYGLRLPQTLSYDEINPIAPTGPCCWQRIDSSCKCTDAPIDDGFNQAFSRFSKGNSG